MKNKYIIKVKYYLTDKKQHNYFIFINDKVQAKGSIPQIELPEARRLAIDHLIAIINDHLLTSK